MWSLHTDPLTPIEAHDDLLLEAATKPEVTHPTGALPKMLQALVKTRSESGERHSRVARLGPGLAVVLSDSGERWAEKDAGVRRLAEMARREAMCDGRDQPGQHALVLLGERSAGRGIVARALLKHLVAGPGAGGDAPPAEGGLAERTALCVQLVSAFTCESSAKAASGGPSLCAHQWRVSFDAEGRPTGVRLELPYSPIGRLPPSADGAPADVRCHALWLFQTPSERGFSGGKSAMRQAQTDGREALQRLMARAAMAPVEQESVVATLGAIARLSELHFYPAAAADKPPELANEAAQKACRAAAQSLGLDEKALRGTLQGGVGADHEAACLAAIALAQELYARLLKWVVDHVNMFLKHAPPPAAAAAGTSAAPASGAPAARQLSRKPAGAAGAASSRALLAQQQPPARKSSKNMLDLGAAAHEGGGGGKRGDVLVLDPPEAAGDEGEAEGGLDELMASYLLEGLLGQMHRAVPPADFLRARKATAAASPGGRASAKEHAGSGLLAFATAPAAKAPAAKAKQVGGSPQDPPDWPMEDATALLEGIAPLAGAAPDALGAALDRCSAALHEEFGADEEEVVAAEQPTRHKAKAAQQQQRLVLLARHNGRAEPVRYAGGARGALLQGAARAWLHSEGGERALSLLRGSSSRFVAALCEPTSEAARVAKQARAARQRATPWLLPELEVEGRCGAAVGALRRVHEATPCFVACISPDVSVKEQTDALGLTATADELLRGFPYAAPLPRWFERYGGLLVHTHGASVHGANLHLEAPRLLQALGVRQSEYLLQNTSLALSAKGLLHAEKTLRARSGATVQLQQLARGRLARKESSKKIEAVAAEKAAVEQAAAEKAATEKAATDERERVAAVGMQKVVKGWAAREEAERRRAALLRLQRFWKTAYRRQAKASLAMQKVVRGRMARAEVKQAKGATRLQAAMRARSSRLLTLTMRRQKQMEEGASAVQRFVRSKLLRFRFARLRHCARFVQARVRVMLLRWEYLGVRDLRRDFHRRAALHREKLEALTEQLAAAEADCDAQGGTNAALEKRRHGLAQVVMRARYQLRQLQVMMVERHRAAIETARKGAVVRGGGKAGAEPGASPRQMLQPPPDDASIGVDVAPFAEAARAAEAELPRAQAEVEAAQAAAAMAETAAEEAAEAAAAAAKRGDGVAEAVGRADEAHAAATDAHGAAAAAAARLQQARHEAAAARDELEMAEAEAAVAREAAAAAARADEERAEATRDALAALSKGGDAAGLLPVATLQLAMEQLEEELDHGATSEPKRYALRRQLLSLGSHYKRRVAEEHQLRRAKQETAAHRAAYVRSRARPASAGAAAAPATPAANGKATRAEPVSAAEATAAATALGVATTTPRSNGRPASAAAGGRGTASTQAAAKPSATSPSHEKTLDDALASWAAESCRQFLRTGRWLDTPGALCQLVERKRNGVVEGEAGAGLMAPAHVMVDASSLREQTPGRVKTASRLLYAPLPSGREGSVRRQIAAEARDAASASSPADAGGTPTPRSAGGGRRTSAIPTPSRRDTPRPPKSQQKTPAAGASPRGAPPSSGGARAVSPTRAAAQAMRSARTAAMAAPGSFSTRTPRALASAGRAPAAYVVAVELCRDEAEYAPRGTHAPSSSAKRIELRTPTGISRPTAN